MIRFLALALLGGVVEAQVQPSRLIDFNRHAWFSYSGDHAVKGRWGVHFDGQWRRAELGLQWQQYQLRPGVNYRVNARLLLTLGYAYTRTYPYGEFPVSAAFPEHRIYQQAFLRTPIRDLPITHRIRMEQRYVQYPQDAGAWTYQNRFRYLLKADIPLSGENGAARWYLPIYDEILIGLPPNYGARPWDQNRVFVGLGRQFEGVGRFEAGYLNQFLGQRNGRVFEFNSTLFVTFTSDVPLSRLFGR